MSCPSRLSQWQQEVSTAFAHLSQPQIWGLVLWSAGMALVGTAGITQISALLAAVLHQREQTVFQRLREWYLEADHKSGDKRRELEVSTCFGPLLRWIVRLWEPTQQQMVLVLDATSLGDRWTVLSVGVVLRGCAIPVAWKVVGGHEKGSWRPHWQRLLEGLAGSLAAEWRVIVLTDRGLWAPWLFQAIQQQGWHPFMRLNLGVKARVVGEERFEWINHWVKTPGSGWKGEVDCFAGRLSRLRATLLLHWEPGYEEPWAVLTDLSPEEAEIAWYGMRTWVETGYKDFKRGLWGWHHSKMQTASRVERLWLAMAVAQLWTVSLGCSAEVQQEQTACSKELPATHIACRKRKRPADQAPARRLSCVVRGRLILVAVLFSSAALPGCGCLVAQAWPEHVGPPSKLPCARALRRRERQRLKQRRKQARARAKARAARG